MDIKTLWEHSGYISSVSKLYALAQKYGVKTTRNNIKTFIDKQTLNQLFKKKNRRTIGHITAFYRGELMQADLLDYQKYKHSNRHYSWILIAVDVFTRQAYAIPLKTKSQDDMYNGLKQLFTSFLSPSRLSTDNGKEFINSKVKQLYKEYKVRHYTNEIDDHNALGIIDRFSRILRERLEKQFIVSKSHVWVDVLPTVINQYNRSPHSALNDVAPIDVGDHDINIFDINMEKDRKIPRHNIKVGDIVRKRLKKTVYEKGATRIWTLDTYKVKKVNKTTAILSNDMKVRIDDILSIGEGEDNSDDIEHKVKLMDNKTSRIGYKRKMDQTKIFKGMTLEQMQALAKQPKMTRSGMTYT